MLLWIVLTISLLLSACFLLQSLVMYLQPAISRHGGSRPAGQPRAMLPELIALEAQFFLSPRLALDEARQLLRALGAPLEPFTGVSDLPSFSCALRRSQAYISRRRTPTGASRDALG